MTDHDMVDLHRRMVRIETRLVLLCEALGFGKVLPGQTDRESKVVHTVSGTRELLRAPALAKTDVLAKAIGEW